MNALTLPRLAGSRGLVVRLLADAPLDLSGAAVVVDAVGLESAAPSFADELCKQLLVERRASHLTVRHASEKFQHYLARSATARGVAERITIEPRTPAA